MTEPLFESRTPRHDLPLLFSAQAQKELFINESLARIDALLHGAIEARQAEPPASPQAGQCWLVAPEAGGAWAGRAGQIATFESGNWLFFAPRDGMRLLDRSSGQEIRFHGSWKIPARPAPVTGGTTIDSEARAALAALVDRLAVAGVFTDA